VLKKRAGFLSEGGRFGFPTRFGRCGTKPANELLFVACVTVTGMLDCRETMALTDYPPKAKFRNPLDAN
jgi:hypothetical protein